MIFEGQENRPLQIMIILMSFGLWIWIYFNYL